MVYITDTRTDTFSISTLYFHPHTYSWLNQLTVLGRTQCDA